MLLEVKNLSKRYTKKSDYTITDVSINGNGGEIVGLLGHNGAGKSTTIKCLTGIHPYEQVTIKICGFDLKTQSIDAKKNFGFVIDEFSLFEKMTGFEFVNFMADMYNVGTDLRKARLEEMQSMFALGDAIYDPIISYSHGMKQKISFMGALIHKPKVIILDEPLIGLDPYTMSQVKAFFKKYSKDGNLVLFSSHQLGIVESLCDRAYIIDQGKMLEEVNFKNFKKTGKDFEEYFLSITKRVSKKWENFGFYLSMN